MFGFDVIYKIDFPDNDIIKISLKEQRAILTRDRDLLKNKQITHGYWVRSNEIEDQVKEVIKRFDLQNDIKEFLRCLDCNSILIPFEKDKIEDRIPPKVKEWHGEFWYCRHCDKIYWKGTHYEKMRNFIERIRNDL